MAKRDVFSRVREDLEAGHTYLATQRLRTLVHNDPHDFEAYRMLAEVYRRTGNPVEAGRWGFLLGDTPEDEITAFERAHPWPWARLRLIRWNGDPADLPCDTARKRWQSLVDAVDESGDLGPDDQWSRDFHPVTRTHRPWLVAVAVAVLVVVGGLGTIGAVRMLEGLVP